MSTNLLAEIERLPVKPQPAEIDASGLPFKPCPVDQGRHFGRRQEPGARWYCSRCLGFGDHDSLVYRVGGKVFYLETCSIGEDWELAA